MLGRGEPVVRIVFVTKREHFQELWRVVEGWRAEVTRALGTKCPPCEYRTESFEFLAASPDFRR